MYTKQFREFEPLNNVRNVKSINVIPNTNTIIYTKAEESWWTHNIYLANPSKKIHIPDINIYKVRCFE